MNENDKYVEQMNELVRKFAEIQKRELSEEKQFNYWHVYAVINQDEFYLGDSGTMRLFDSLFNYEREGIVSELDIRRVFTIRGTPPKFTDDFIAALFAVKSNPAHFANWEGEKGVLRTSFETELEGAKVKVSLCVYARTTIRGERPRQVDKTIVYFSFGKQDPQNNPIVDIASGYRYSRPHDVYRKFFPAIEKFLGKKLSAHWEQTAGCTCPCSPGFVTTDNLFPELAGIGSVLSVTLEH